MLLQAFPPGDRHINFAFENAATAATDPQRTGMTKSLAIMKAWSLV